MRTAATTAPEEARARAKSCAMACVTRTANEVIVLNQEMLTGMIPRRWIFLERRPSIRRRLAGAATGDFIGRA